MNRLLETSDDGTMTRHDARAVGRRWMTAGALAAALASALLPDVARADDSPGQAPTAPLSLADLSATTRGGAELAFASLSPELAIQTRVLVGDVRLTRRLALSGRLPSFTSTLGGESRTGLGNPSLGARYLDGWRLGAGAIRIGAGGSVSAPLAGDLAEAASAPAAPWRIGEWAPGVVGLRLDGDVRWEVGRAFAQAEAGFDGLLRVVGDEARFAPLVGLGLGAGVRATRELAVLGELLSVTDALRGSRGQAHWLRALAVGARLGVGRFAVAGRVHVPLGEDLGGFPIGFGIDLLARL